MSSSVNWKGFFEHSTYKYDDVSAFRECIDNSIDAGASEIWIDIQAKHIMIYDNGNGISAEVASQKYIKLYQSDVDHPPKHGRFNFGSKGAMYRLSQHEKVRVLTYHSSDRDAHGSEKEEQGREIMWDFPRVILENSLEPIRITEGMTRTGYKRWETLGLETGTAIVFESANSILYIRSKFLDPEWRSRFIGILTAEYTHDLQKTSIGIRVDDDVYPIPPNPRLLFSQSPDVWKQYSLYVLPRGQDIGRWRWFLRLNPDIVYEIQKTKVKLCSSEETMELSTCRQYPLYWYYPKLLSECREIFRLSGDNWESFEEEYVGYAILRYTKLSWKVSPPMVRRGDEWIRQVIQRSVLVLSTDVYMDRFVGVSDNKSLIQWTKNNQDILPVKHALDEALLCICRYEREQQMAKQSVAVNPIPLIVSDSASSSSSASQTQVQPHQAVVSSSSTKKNPRKPLSKQVRQDIVWMNGHRENHTGIKLDEWYPVEIDHKDERPDNNSLDNLQALGRNLHGIKTLNPILYQRITEHPEWYCFQLLNKLLETDHVRNAFRQYPSDIRFFKEFHDRVEQIVKDIPTQWSQ